MIIHNFFIEAEEEKYIYSLWMFSKDDYTIIVGMEREVDCDDFKENSNICKFIAKKVRDFNEPLSHWRYIIEKKEEQLSIEDEVAIAEALDFLNTSFNGF